MSLTLFDMLHSKPHVTETLRKDHSKFRLSVSEMVTSPKPKRVLSPVHKGATAPKTVKEQAERDYMPYFDQMARNQKRIHDTVKAGQGIIRAKLTKHNENLPLEKKTLTKLHDYLDSHSPPRLTGPSHNHDPRNAT